jgi:hypothetical protein
MSVLVHYKDGVVECTIKFTINVNSANIVELLQTVLLHEYTTMIWMQNKNLLKVRMMCDNCNVEMILQSESDPKWNCSICSRKKSIRANSIFSDSHLSLKQLTLILYHFWYRDSLARTAAEIWCSMKTVSQWFTKLKIIIISNILKKENSIGGDDVVVEVDEVCLRRRKYKKGKGK